MAPRSLHTPQPINAAPARTAARVPERVAERGTERRDERRLERPDNRRLTDDGRFSIDLNAVPPGFVMEWKRHQIMGMNDKQNQVRIRQFYWEPVTHKMQPQILGHLCNNNDEHVMIDGMGLYMRPEYLNEEARAEDRAATDHVLGEQLQSLRLSSAQQVGSARTFIKKQTVGISQPVE